MRFAIRYQELIGFYQKIQSSLLLVGWGEVCGDVQNSLIGLLVGLVGLESYLESLYVKKKGIFAGDCRNLGVE